jgi:hypothetical protein
MEAPGGHMSSARGLQGRDRSWKLCQRGTTDPIQELRGAGLEIGAPYPPSGGGLLSSEAQDTINRDELFWPIKSSL